MLRVFLDLWGQSIPYLDGKVAIHCSKGGNEGIPKNLDCMFCSIDTMVMRLNKLQFALVFVKELLDVLGGLVVHDIEIGFEASFW